MQYLKEKIFEHGSDLYRTLDKEKSVLKFEN